MKNKKILITGASSGIGESVAYSLSKLGYTLCISGRNEERLNQVYHKIGSNHHFILSDLSDKKNIDSLISTCVEKVGPLDGFVHCAGIAPIEPMRFYSDINLKKTIAVNLVSAFNILACLRKPAHHAEITHVVFMSSISATHGQAALSAYCATKAGLEAAVRSWSVELAREGFRINCIAPGFIQTAMGDSLLKRMDKNYLAQLQARHPLGFGEPQDIANAVCFLLSDNARWITGTTFHVDGGFHAT